MGALFSIIGHLVAILLTPLRAITGRGATPNEEQGKPERSADNRKQKEQAPVRQVAQAASHGNEKNNWGKKQKRKNERNGTVKMQSSPEKETSISEQAHKPRDNTNDKKPEENSVAGRLFRKLSVLAGEGKPLRNIEQPKLGGRKLGSVEDSTTGILKDEKPKDNKQKPPKFLKDSTTDKEEGMPLKTLEGKIKDIDCVKFDSRELEQDLGSLLEIMSSLNEELLKTKQAVTSCIQRLQSINSDKGRSSTPIIEETQVDNRQKILDLHENFKDVEIDTHIPRESVAFMEMVKERARTFERRVLEYSGTNYSIQYFILDESLSRLLDLLDRIRCRENKPALTAKLEAIKFIRNLHQELDSRAHS